jgi:hypothetical protein
MDILNDYNTRHPPNPINDGLSDSEISENEDYVNKLKTLNINRKRKKEFTFDDWSMIYSDDLWYLWCIISEFKKNSNVLDKMDYSNFCSMCYENSTKK